MNNTDDNDNEQHKKTIYYKLAFASAILSVAICAALLGWYLGSLSHEKISDMASGIFVPAGFFATIAGTLFVVDNLYLQREDLRFQKKQLKYQIDEIEKQRIESEKSNAHYHNQTEIMRTQQAETTFFNLLKHNEHLFLSSGLNHQIVQEIVNEFIENTKLYRSFIHGGVFSPSTNTSRHPAYQLARCNSAYTLIGNYFENLSNIIDFISDSFNDKSKEIFYHKTLYHSLTENQRYLLGILIDYNLYNLKNPLNFSYSRAYDNNFFLYKNKEFAFPVVHLNVSHNLHYFSWLASSNVSLSLTAAPFYSEIKDNLKILSMEIKSGFHLMDKVLFDSKVKIVEKEALPDSLMSVDLKPALEPFSKTNNSRSTGAVCIKFVSEFIGRKFEIYYAMKIVFHEDNRGSGFVLNSEATDNKIRKYFFPN